MKQVRNCLLIAAVVFGCVTPALAGERSGAITLSPMIGYLFFDDGQGVDDAFLGGLGAAYSLTREWEAELFYGYSNPDATGGGDADVSLLRLDGL